MEKDLVKAVIDPKLRRALKSQARTLQPSLRIGKSGLTANLHGEITSAFLGKQLLKLRFERSAESKAADIINQIERQHKCTLVQKLGRVVTFYRLPGVVREIQP
jgi:RNA-binding protein